MSPKAKRFVDNSPQTLADYSREWIDSKLKATRGGGLYPWTKSRAQEFQEISTEELLYDKYFLYGSKKVDGHAWLRPKIADIVIEIVDEWENNGLDLAIIVGAYGIGKTVFASLLQWILWFKFSTRYDPSSDHAIPQEYYGFRPDQDVSFLSLSKSLKQAQNITFNHVKKSFNSQFNRDYFPIPNPRVKLLEVERNHTNIFPNTATEAANAGYDVYSAVIDEASFMEEIEDSAKSAVGGKYDQAESAFRSTFGRMKSRFRDPTKLNGMVIMISSLNHSEDFLMRKIREVRAQQEEELSVYYKIAPPWKIIPNLIHERDEKQEYFYFDTDTLNIIDDEDEVEVLDKHWTERPYEEVSLGSHDEDPNWQALKKYREEKKHSELQTENA